MEACFMRRTAGDCNLATLFRAKSMESDPIDSGVWLFRRDQKMDMVCHEHISVYLAGCFICVFF